MSLLASALVLWGGQATHTAESDEFTADSVGHDCVTNKCSSDAGGCASCIQITVTLPPNAWITKVHCFTNANYPDDFPRHDLHEVNCGTDVSFSIFDTPDITATPAKVVVRTTYHNRSSNQSRDIKLKVDWRDHR